MLTGSEDGVLHMWRPADQPNIKPADKKKVTQACSYTSNTNVSIVSVYSNPSSPVLTVGWVNLYEIFEIEKFTVCGKFILLKKIGRHFLNFCFGTTGMRICMDLLIFASFLYPTLLNICTQKF